MDPFPAISLTFDDGLDEHLDHAVRLLDAQQLRGTFYVHLSASSFCRRLDDWVAAAHGGHELGNHTLFHPADARKSWVREGNALDLYSPDRMRQELELANQLLESLDGESERTFAYPCSNAILGHRGIVKRLLFRLGYERTRLPGLVDRWHLDFGSTEQSYTPLVSELFTAARAGGLEKSSRVASVQQFNRWLLPSVAVDNWSVEELISYTERGLNDGTWVILQFHGVGGGHRLDCELGVFQRFTEWLSLNYVDRVAPVKEIAARLWPRRSLESQAASRSAHSDG